MVARHESPCGSCVWCSGGGRCRSTPLMALAPPGLLDWTLFAYLGGLNAVGRIVDSTTGQFRGFAATCCGSRSVLPRSPAAVIWCRHVCWLRCLTDRPAYAKHISSRGDHLWTLVSPDLLLALFVLPCRKVGGGFEGRTDPIYEGGATWVGFCFRGDRLVLH